MEFPGAPVRSTAVKSVTFDQRQIISKNYAQQTAPGGPAPDTSINVSNYSLNRSGLL
jgi:hypothetical protein